MNSSETSDSKSKYDVFGLSHSIKIILLLLYFVILAFTAIWGVYIITYILFIFIFLVISSNMGGYRYIDKYLAQPKWQKIVLLFAIALFLRWVMLFQTQVITKDLITYVWRSENMLEGQIPYRDFYGGNKPPLYEFMLYGMGILFGAGTLQFRAFFSVCDALIPVVLYYLCMEKYNERFAVVSGLIYALFPISIICVGLSGHYDCIVAIFSLIGLLYLFRNKLCISSLSLGVAFALKIYPVVLLPFFLSTIKTWKARILYVICFAIPTLIADGTLFLISRDAFFEYLHEESMWEGASAFSSIIEMAVKTDVFFSVKISWLVLGFFGLLILLMFWDWLSPKRNANLIKWTKIMIFIYIFYYAFYLLFAVMYYNQPILLAALANAIYLPLVIFLYFKYSNTIVPNSLSESKDEGLFIVSTYAIMLFLMGLPNIAPWYFIWFFPFLLAIKTDKIRYILLWIFPWHGIGKNMRLLPGTAKIN
jgi:hypothetical protein